MFDFLKSTRKATQLGIAFGDTFGRVMHNRAEEAHAEVSALLSFGADPLRVQAEFAAFYFFQHYLAFNFASIAGKLDTKQALAFRDAFAQQVEQGAASVDLLSVGTVSYSSVSEWLGARMGQYQSAFDSATPDQAARILVDQFCDFAFLHNPGDEVKTMLESNYETLTYQVFRQISEARLA
jgi:hypothetical protein